jgi:hypothetical protein
MKYFIVLVVTLAVLTQVTLGGEVGSGVMDIFGGFAPESFSTSEPPQTYSGYPPGASVPGYSYSSHTQTTGHAYPTGGLPTPEMTCTSSNEYRILAWPYGTLKNEAVCRYGETLELWSNINTPGIYLSYEWFTSYPGYYYYQSPDVNDFGFKSAGWYPTWFRASSVGEHILYYYCNGWSNRITITVQPYNS